MIVSWEAEGTNAYNRYATCPTGQYKLIFFTFTLNVFKSLRLLRLWMFFFFYLSSYSVFFFLSHLHAYWFPYFIHLFTLLQFFWGIVPSVSIAIGITVTFVFDIFFSSIIIIIIISFLHFWHLYFSACQNLFQKYLFMPRFVIENAPF